MLNHLAALASRLPGVELLDPVCCLCRHQLDESWSDTEWSHRGPYHACCVPPRVREVGGAYVFEWIEEEARRAA